MNPQVTLHVITTVSKSLPVAYATVKEIRITVKCGNPERGIPVRTNVLTLLAILQINEYNIFTTQAGSKQWQMITKQPCIIPTGGAYIV